MVFCENWSSREVDREGEVIGGVQRVVRHYFHMV